MYMIYFKYAYMLVSHLLSLQNISRVMMIIMALTKGKEVFYEIIVTEKVLLFINNYNNGIMKQLCKTIYGRFDMLSEVIPVIIIT